MSRYFVTGATGFVGGRVAAQLREAGHHVVALVRDPARAGALAEIGVELARGDVTDRAKLAAPMRDADGVFHIAGWYKIGARDPQEGERINVDGTRNVLEVMRELRIPRGVYTSTLAVYGDTRGAARTAGAAASCRSARPPRTTGPPGSPTRTPARPSSVRWD